MTLNYLVDEVIHSSYITKLPYFSYFNWLLYSLLFLSLAFSAKIKLTFQKEVLFSKIRLRFNDYLFPHRQGEGVINSYKKLIIHDYEVAKD
jgi:hypothetical protein